MYILCASQLDYCCLYMHESKKVESATFSLFILLISAYNFVPCPFYRHNKSKFTAHAYLCPC